MITTAQAAALYDIRRMVACCLRHPSPKVRERVAGFRQQDVDRAVEYIDRAAAEQDGHQAWHIIKAWRAGTEAAVIKYVRENA